jgi:ribose transport system permease protein
MAIGMTLVILTGGIDLSVGSLLALGAVIASLLIREIAGGEQAGTFGMILACAGAITICGLLGLVTGWLVTRFHIAPFLVTLALMLMASGAAYRITKGESVYQVPDSFTWLGRGSGLLGLPNAVILMFFLYGLAHLMMTRMVIGRHLYAVGGNRVAARLSGIPVERVLLFAYVMSALLAGLGGVVMASQLKSGSPTYGDMYELYVIAAVVVGGTSLSGGRGSMIGTLLGAFTIAVIQNGMNLMNVESYTQKIVLGSVILGAVWLDRVRRKGE